MSLRRTRPAAASKPTGVEIDVQRGAVTFKVSHQRVRCSSCEASAPIDRLHAFLDTHELVHRPARPAPPPAAVVDVDALAARLRVLGVDELAVVGEVVAGLERGRGVYGQLRIDTDPRDHDRETLDEVRDGLVYAAIASIRRRRGGST